MNREQGDDLQAEGRQITFTRTPESAEPATEEARQGEQIRRPQPPPVEQQAPRRRPYQPGTPWSPKAALRSRQQVRQAIILSEFLDPPKALRRSDDF